MATILGLVGTKLGLEYFGYDIPNLLSLGVIMSLLGGLLTIVFAAWHYTVTRRRDAKIPYGVAIASSALITLAPTLEAGWRSVTGA